MTTFDMSRKLETLEMIQAGIDQKMQRGKPSILGCGKHIYPERIFSECPYCETIKYLTRRLAEIETEAQGLYRQIRKLNKTKD